MRSNKIIILSGLSGAGKTTGVHALEDLGFYCVDNLPVGLVLSFLELCERGDGIQKIALVIDIREGEFLSGAAEMIQDLKAKGYPLEVLFLEAAEDILVRRYQETRRRHPAAAHADTLRGAIIKEREILAPLRQTAEGVIDTSSLNVHQLKRAIRERYQSQEGQSLSLCLLSFGFKHGLPPESDMVLDVRFLPNPYFSELRHKNGQDAEVSAYALKDAGSFLQLAESLLRDLLPRYQREGRSNFTLAIGCTGGKHRSVAVVEELSKRLGDITRSSVVHRDIEKL
jgi:UPF0042 nucleotide-binding protein